MNISPINNSQMNNNINVSSPRFGMAYIVSKRDEVLLKRLYNEQPGLKNLMESAREMLKNVKLHVIAYIKESPEGPLELSHKLLCPVLYIEDGVLKQKLWGIDRLTSDIPKLVRQAIRLAREMQESYNLAEEVQRQGANDVGVEFFLPDINKIF